MSDRVFIDTNIFVYMQRADDKRKQRVARETIDTFTCVASTQVLKELCSIFTKKIPIPVEDLQKIVAAVRATCEVDVVDNAAIDEALLLFKRYGFSFFDCLILVSALRCGCKYIFTEDMREGQTINGSLKIVNIFAHQELLGI
jgi:predicted nucleic acid-binding protein